MTTLGSLNCGQLTTRAIVETLVETQVETLHLSGQVILRMSEATKPVLTKMCHRLWYLIKYLKYCKYLHLIIKFVVLYNHPSGPEAYHPLRTPTRPPVVK